MKYLLAVVLTGLALILFAGCGDQCLVTVSGNKLCGSDAAAWCRATDPIRQGSSDPSVKQTQALCDKMESNY